MRAIKKLWLLKVLLFVAIDVYAQGPKDKAYYLFNFIQFIDWPHSCQSNDFVVGVIGETPVFQELDQLLTGKKIYNQLVVVKKFSNPDMATRCHVIFVAESYCDQISCIINRFRSFNTLIVCERSGMVRRGSAISFLVLNSKLSYEVNKQSIQKSGLQSDSQLELLATNTK